MSEWIEINLPWDDRGHLFPKYKEYPDLKERARQVFGETLEEVMSRTIDSRKGKDDWSRPVFNSFENLQQEIREQLQKEDLIQGADMSAEEFNSKFESELRRRMEKLNHSDVKLVYEYRDFKNKYNAWLDIQSENIETAALNEKIRADFHADQLVNGTSFVARKLNRAGTVIEVQSTDGVVRQMLIGTINELGGACNDCMDISNSDIIKRYKIIWQPDNN